MFLNLDHIRAAAVRARPYPYFVVPASLLEAEGIRALDDFPPISRPGAVAVEETLYGPEFGRLLEELRGEPFRAVIAEKLGIDLEGLTSVINVRGMTRWTDGNIHTDRPSKLVTVLLYFNQPGQAEGTGLRILNGAKNLDEFVEEIPPLLGTMVVFKVTPNCWHGHQPHEGVRRSLQLNYLSGSKTIVKHQLAYRLWSRFKRKLSRK